MIDFFQPVLYSLRKSCQGFVKNISIPRPCHGVDSLETADDGFQYMAPDLAQASCLSVCHTLDFMQILQIVQVSCMDLVVTVKRQKRHN